MANEGFKAPIVGVGIINEGNSPLIDVGGVGGMYFVSLVFPGVDGLLLWNFGFGNEAEVKTLGLQHANNHLEPIISSIFEVEKSHG